MVKGHDGHSNVTRLHAPNPGKRKKKNKPQTEVGAPEKPPGLSTSATEIWDDVVSELTALKVIARVDKNQIAAYCNIVARTRDMQDFIDKNGYTYITRGKSGEMERIRPQVKILETCEKQIRAFAQEWGMSAASRARLNVDDGQGELFDDPTAGY